jgi:hypothetical protein
MGQTDGGAFAFVPVTQEGHLQRVRLLPLGRCPNLALYSFHYPIEIKK